MASSARCIAGTSKCARTVDSNSSPARASSARSSSVNSPGSGTIPSRFLATIDSDRCARLPNSLARSALIAGDDRVLAVAAVLPERHLAQEEVAHRVDAERVDEVHRVDDVAHRLAHLLAAVEHEAVHEDPARQLDSRRHQERGPVHGVEPDDVLADHVQIGRPESLEQLRGRVGKADAGQVVGQRVDPHVHHVIGMVGHRHAPVERRAGDRQVAQPAGDEADHLVAPDVGPDELGMGLVVGEQLVGVGGQPEEVGLLLGPRHRRAGLGRDPHPVGADGGLGLGEEAFVADRVPALVGVEIDVAGLVHPAPDLLGRLDSGRHRIVRMNRS